MVRNKASQIPAENVYVALLSPEQNHFFFNNSRAKKQHLGGK